MKIHRTHFQLMLNGVYAVRDQAIHELENACNKHRAADIRDKITALQNVQQLEYSLEEFKKSLDKDNLIEVTL